MKASKFLFLFCFVLFQSCQAHPPKPSVEDLAVNVIPYKYARDLSIYLSNPNFSDKSGLNIDLISGIAYLNLISEKSPDDSGDYARSVLQKIIYCYRNGLITPPVAFDLSKVSLVGNREDDWIVDIQSLVKDAKISIAEEKIIVEWIKVRKP